MHVQTDGEISVIKKWLAYTYRSLLLLLYLIFELLFVLDLERSHIHKAQKIFLETSNRREKNNGGNFHVKTIGMFSLKLGVCVVNKYRVF